MRINNLSSAGSTPRQQKIEQLEPKAGLGQVEALRSVPNRFSEQRSEVKRPPEVTATDVQNMVDDVNKVIRYINERLQFSVHEETNRIMVKVLDRETEEVLREIPPEKMLDLISKLQEIAGLLVDKKV